MRLAAIGINRCPGIAQGAYKFDITVRIPLEGVVVVINQDGVRPALTCHIKRPNQPVVTCLSATAERLLHHRIALLVSADGLIHHINHRQCRVFLLDSIKPLHDGCVAVLDGHAGAEPVGILCSPYQRMELVGEFVLLSIIEGFVTTPVETSFVALHRAPFRLVLAGNLVPEFVVLLYSASGIHIIPGGDVAQEFVGVG